MEMKKENAFRASMGLPPTTSCCEDMGGWCKFFMWGIFNVGVLKPKNPFKQCYYVISPSILVIDASKCI